MHTITTHIITDRGQVSTKPTERKPQANWGSCLLPQPTPHHMHRIWHIVGLKRSGLIYRIISNLIFIVCRTRQPPIPIPHWINWKKKKYMKETVKLQPNMETLWPLSAHSTVPFFLPGCAPLLTPGVSYLLLINPPGAAGPPGPQDLALFFMGRVFALSGLEATAHFSQNDKRISAKAKKKKR